MRRSGQLQDIKADKQSSSWLHGLCLFILWLGINLGDRLWLQLDQSIPAWDQANHLTNSLKYLENILHFSGWQDFWRVSTQYPPLTYLVAVPFQLLFGKGNDQALMANFVFSALLIAAVYGIGKRLFNAEVGCWSAAIALLMPRFTEIKLHFLTDFALTTMTAVTFACLTHWYFAEHRKIQWLWILGFGLSLGFALLNKQACLFYLFFPLLWSGISSLWQKNWEKALQLIVGLFCSIPVWGGWYRTNYIYLFSTYQVSNSIAPGNEGDPAVNTLNAWLYYWRDLPSAVSWLLLLVPLVGICLHFLKRFPQRKTTYQIPAKTALTWLGIYLLGAYFIFSLIYNKDFRFILPFLPMVAIVLGYGLTQWRGKWLVVRWVTVGGAVIFWVGQLFPLPLVSGLAARSIPVDTNDYPHETVITEVLNNAPYLRSNLGVIPSLPWLNHNNLNHFGALRDFQVYGRELANNWDQVEQDAQGFDWFLTKTGENGNAKEAQLQLAALLPQDSNFKLQNTWNLPDQTQLSLYYRREPLATVVRFDQRPQGVQLDRVEVPEVAIAGQPLPITYHWSGNWQDLEKGIVLLTWANGENFWIHDHGFAFGMLHAGRLKMDERGDRFGVIERTATLPPKDLPAGTYQLQAVYLDPSTGKTQPINIQPVSVEITPSQGTEITPLQLVQLDWLTQLRAIAVNLGLGLEGIDPVFAHVARVNQYDPVQHYLQQVEDSLGYRLSQPQGVSESQIKDWYFAKALAHALQEESQSVIDTLGKFRDLDPNNALIHAYIAFVHLYQWEPKQADMEIQTAIALAPDKPEFQAIAGAAALLQGKLFKTWSIVQTLKQEGIL